MAPQTLPRSSLVPSPLPSSVKELTSSASLRSVPPQYATRNLPETTIDIEPLIQEEIPTVDFSLLIEGTPEQRSQMVRHLGKACEEWGFFMVLNHGIPERLREAMLDSMKEFFDQTEEEKGRYAGKHVMDPIRYGTSFNASVEDVMHWRDYLKVFVHPVFYSPAKRPGFREVSKEYTARTRAMGMELLRGIWESLGLEENDMTKALDLHSCFQLIAGNLYPPCPQPELATGLPAHSDFGLLTILLQNGVNGLQVKHRGNWVRVQPLPNSFVVNIGDHMEIVSNGRYKSVLHRAEVNSQSTRLSIPSAVAPSLDAIVEPASRLVSDEHPVMFRGMRFGEFFELQQANRLKEKSILDLVRLHAE